MNPLSGVSRSGSGAPVVLIHGVGLDRGMWDELALALDGVCEVIRYDMLAENLRLLEELGVR